MPYLLDLSLLLIILLLILIVSIHEIGVGLRAEDGLIDGVINHQLLFSFGVYLRGRY
jgi:hypothetical protein